MKKTTVKTFTATIYVGLKNRATGKEHRPDALRKACCRYVNQVGLCVTFTPTEFIYSNGMENGVIVGLINYPRFPSSKAKIKKHAVHIAEILLKQAEQLKVSVVMPGETVMIASPDSPEQ